MALNKTNFLTGSTDRAWSDSIWGNCPWADFVENGNGCIFFDDFMSCNKTPATTEGNFTAENGYSQFSDTGGTITNDTTERGGAIAIGSDGDNEGCSIRTTVTPFKIIQNGGELWFETRIATSTIADTKHNILIGLMEDVALTATIPITATGTIGDKNIVGFRRTEAASGGALIDFVYKCDGVTAVTQSTAIATLVAATYIKLGFHFYPTGYRSGNNYLVQYVNGVQAGTPKAIPSAAGTDFPNDINLGFFFAVLNATGTTPGTSSIDWVRIAQRF